MIYSLVAVPHGVFVVIVYSSTSNRSSLCENEELTFQTEKVQKEIKFDCNVCQCD